MKNNKVLNDCGLRNRGIDLVTREILSIRFDIDLLWAFPDTPTVDFSSSIHQIRFRLRILLKFPFFDSNPNFRLRIYEVYHDLGELQMRLREYSTFDIVHNLQLQSCSLTGLYGYIYKLLCK